ncbi:M67 family metallopeptidase [Paenibacillus fonticola]|uniref:M67 family metallopeptidase n=1 Tax=Paenibacillus fonticola TaxID=379896 RepID=UPI00036836CF|nr:M67 family metallopeptidase [Paenibacillus fonticola]
MWNHGEQHRLPHKWVIVPHVYEQMKEDASSRYPQEACGVLFGNMTADPPVIDSYLPIRNVSPRPHQNFVLDPEQWVKCCFNSRLIGLFHSHPSALPVPSETDLQQLPLFSSLLRLYLIGSCHPAEDIVQEAHDGYRFTLNGYHVTRMGSKLPTLDPADIVIMDSKIVTSD